MLTKFRFFPTVTVHEHHAYAEGTKDCIEGVFSMYLPKKDEACVETTSTHSENMVLIPAGTFELGNNDAESFYEQQVHTWHVNAFYMDTHAVTNLEYQQFLIENSCWQKNRIQDEWHDGDYLLSWDGNKYPTGQANHPVTWVSWYSAMAYAIWVGKRLPTEVEWEYAARAGLSDKKYPWGDVLSTVKANYDRNVGDTTAVGKYLANGYGLYDMSGNVWEWCLDLYDDDFYFASPRKNPRSGTNEPEYIINNFMDLKTERVLRGGGWSTSPQGICVSHRFLLSPKNTIYDCGFRCVQ